MAGISTDSRGSTRRGSRNLFVGLGFLLLAAFLACFPVAVSIGSQSERCPDQVGWQILFVVLGGVALLWAGFLLRHAIRASHAAVRVNPNGVSIRNIGSRHEFLLHEVDGFYAASSAFSYDDEIFFTALFYTFAMGLQVSMPNNTNVEGIHVRLMDGREFPVWSLTDNTDDPMYGWPRQKTEFNWPAVAEDLNRQLDEARGATRTG